MFKKKCQFIDSDTHIGYEARFWLDAYRKFCYIKRQAICRMEETYTH